MSRRLVLLLAATCAVVVGNVYFPQAVGPLVAAGLGVSAGSAALVATAAQAGYAAGILLLAPLADRLPNRRLMVVLLVCTGVGLFAAGCAPALGPLLVAGVFVGGSTVAGQVAVPMAVGLVPAERRGAMTGTLLSGSIGGMLLARAFGGMLGEWLGWRAPYLVAAVLSLLLAVVLACALPEVVPRRRGRWSAPPVEALRLLRAEPELRRSCFYQAAVFAGFSAVWTCLALLLAGPAYGLGARAVGVLALVGGVTMFCTPVAGRLVDRYGADPVNLVCMVGGLASAGVLAAGAGGGASGMAALVAGTLLLDIAMQSGMVANQARVFALRADARGRLNTAYMACAFLGGGAGSWTGAEVYARAGWPGVCALAALLCGLALARHLVAVHGARARRGRAAPPGQ
ncbi:MFS transporter [Nocardiopsis potens]|uniref:MFS transporter n=1 Tax=Nocardiopsis potens TaxID=1246458 RepID=UPI000346C020|nr:MFS transporter [Nocardiopsis potens]